MNTRSDNIPVIMTWAGKFLVPKKNVNTTVNIAPT